MTEQEYKNQLLELERQFNIAKKNLVIAFGRANRKYSKGDIIKNLTTGDIMKIELASYISYMPSPFNFMPTIRYEGYDLKADLTPRKHPKYFQILQEEAILIKKG